MAFFTLSPGADVMGGDDAPPLLHQGQIAGASSSLFFSHLLVTCQQMLAYLFIVCFPSTRMSVSCEQSYFFRFVCHCVPEVQTSPWYFVAAQLNIFE